VLVDPPVVDIPAVRKAAASPLELGPGAQVIGYAGRLEHGRGLPALVRAAARLAAREREFRLVMAGDGPEATHLAILARDLGVPLTLTGPVDSTAAALAAFDVAAFAGSGAGAPTPLLEAAAIGTPLVLGEAPGVRGLFAPGEEALYVHADADLALADALDAVLADPTAARRRAAAARHRTVDEYAVPVMVERYLDLYRTLGAHWRPEKIRSLRAKSARRGG
jgi:glycogen(starch) synthase